MNYKGVAPTPNFWKHIKNIGKLTKLIMTEIAVRYPSPPFYKSYKATVWSPDAKAFSYILQMEEDRTY